MSHSTGNCDLVNRLRNTMTKVIAIIPARGGSQSIKRKNLALLQGEPLVVRAIRQARAATSIGAILVNSEDAEIRAVAQRAGAQVMDRPEEFYHDNSTQEVDRLLRWTILELERAGQRHSVVVLLYATAPLRPPGVIDACVRKVTHENFDCALTLYHDHSYLWRAQGDTVAPTNYQPELRGPRQKENWNQLVENKAVYAMTRDLLVNTRCRLGGRIGWVEMSRLHSIDIDSPEDLMMAEFVASAGLA
jgi:N-acylneuraminate cytidylyltransferase